MTDCVVINFLLRWFPLSSHVLHACFVCHGAWMTLQLFWSPNVTKGCGHVLHNSLRSRVTADESEGRRGWRAKDVVM